MKNPKKYPSEPSPPIARGRVLRLKSGYNPNSSSIGSDIPTFLAFAASDKGLAVPTCHHEGRQRRGHPVVIDAKYVPEIRGLSGGQGLRELFVRHADDTEFVPFDTPLVVDDLDTPEDYERLLQREVQ